MVLSFPIYFLSDELVLFRKASVEQVLVIENVLKYFCDCSGQKLSKEKSVVFFSQNVDDRTADMIGHLLGMKVTNNLG